MKDQLQNALILLIDIRNQVEDSFPVATIKQTFNGTGSVDFRIQKQANRYAVNVTEPFLDADGGIDAALSVLARLGAELQRLAPGHVLVVTDKVFPPKPPAMPSSRASIHSANGGSLSWQGPTRS